MKKIEKEKEWKINVRETILRNFIWMFMFVLVFIFIFIIISKTDSFLDEGFKIMWLVVCVFMAFKMLDWVGHPTIVLREESQ